MPSHHLCLVSLVPSMPFPRACRSLPCLVSPSFDGFESGGVACRRPAATAGPPPTPPLVSREGRRRQHHVGQHASVRSKHQRRARRRSAASPCCPAAGGASGPAVPSPQELPGPRSSTAPEAPAAARHPSSNSAFPAVLVSPRSYPTTTPESNGAVCTCKRCSTTALVKRRGITGRCERGGGLKAKG